mgnify:FL=1
MDPITEILEMFPAQRREDLIPILQEIQKRCGYLTEEAIVKTGRYLKLPASKVFGIATFYDAFAFKPRGTFHIRICNGSQCHMEGSARLVAEVEKILHIRLGETTSNGLFSLEVTTCLGGCHNAPVLQVNEDYFIRLSPAELRNLIKKLEDGHQKE